MVHLEFQYKAISSCIICTVLSQLKHRVQNIILSLLQISYCFPFEKYKLGMNIPCKIVPQ